MAEYIKNKLNSDKFCIDYFEDDLYKNGFAKYEDMKEFIDYNFRADIRGLFPNYASLVIGYISLPFLFALIIFSITRITYKDSPHKDFEGNSFYVCCVKAIVIISFLTFFLGFYIYITYKFSQNKNRCKRFQKIKTNFYISEFIEYYCGQKIIEKRAFLAETILFPIPAIIFISGWIYHIYYNIYLKEAYKAKVLGIKQKKIRESDLNNENINKSEEIIINNIVTNNGNIKPEIINKTKNNNNIIMNKIN
jgi:NADH:ubiquinone oxidoreductase subunit 5 (subunit L)/multisubunit Na+/H+ antiporter MnhA subunit